MELGEMKKVVMKFGLKRIQRVGWYGPRSILILTNTKIPTIEVSLDGQTSFVEEVYAVDGLTKLFKCETTLAEDSAILQAVRTHFHQCYGWCTVMLILLKCRMLRELWKNVVFLKLSNLEVPQLSLTTSSGTIHVTDSESIAVTARAGQQKFSTSVSIFALEGEQPGRLNFQEEF